MQAIVTILLWYSAIGCGLIAGLYFAFSAFIMTAFRRIDQAQGIAAMNSINSTILGSLFMPLFFGTTIASAALAVLALFRWSEPGAAAMHAGGLLYVIGMFGCTVVFNVPLNNRLARAEATAADAAAVWARYLKDWTFWNHLRSIASAVAMALFIVALLATGRTRVEQHGPSGVCDSLARVAESQRDGAFQVIPGAFRRSSRLIG